MIYPSVTKVISPFVDFSMIRDDILKAASERGTAAHNACFAYALGLPSFGMTEEVKGYFDSFRRWFDQVVDVVIFCEHRLIDDTFGFHGEPDLLVRAKHGEILLPDLKTPRVKSRSWRLQMAGYNRLIEISDFPNPARIGSLRLSPEGKTPTMDWYEHNRVADFNVFLSCLTAYRFFNIS